MGTASRRQAILKILSRRRYETIKNLADQLEVSTRTIRRDIDALSLTEPIYTIQGHDGGVHMLDSYRIDRCYFTDTQTALLTGILACAKQKKAYRLTAAEIEILARLLAEYTKPQKIKEN